MTRFDCDSDYKRIFRFLSENQGVFTPPLAQELDLKKYSRKLSLNAVNIFMQARRQDVSHSATYINHQEKKAFISSFCVSAPFQGKGAGVAMMERIINLCKREDMDVIMLEVHKRNDAAVAFYRKIGFAETGSNERKFQMAMTLRS